MNAEEEQKKSKLVAEAVRMLSEHFDSVQILCTLHQENNTKSWDLGCGNFYARLGHARDWLFRDKVLTEKEELDKLDPGED